MSTQPTRKRKRPQKKGLDPKQPLKPLIIWIIAIFSLLLLFKLGDMKSPNLKVFSYTEFLSAVKDGSIKDFELGEHSVTGRGRMTNGGRYKVNILRDDQGMYKQLQENNVNVTVKESNKLFDFFFTFILPPLVFIFLLWFFMYRQMRGMGKGALSFGKSKAKLLSQEHDRVTFLDVAGIQEAKEEVEEIVDFLKDPKKFQKLGGRIPKGVMLMGPPGTGKTLLAKAIAGEAKVPFFSISGSDFVEMFVGVGASRVRDMFAQGKKHAPCLIFIDEIDAVGRHRGAGIGGGHDEREQTLNALLVEMDGFNTGEGVIIIAATNRPDVLDPALLRPGRFDRQIVIDLPDLKGREGILNVHTQKVIVDKKVDLNKVARGTPGFSGADLANLVNEAALLAARRGKKAVTLEEFEEARDKVKWGRERRSITIDEDDRRVTAYHEAGHAVVLELIEDTEPLHKVTIIPRGISYLGATMQLPERDKFHQTKKELLGQIAGLMGGRIAEELTFSSITSGSRSDIKNATRIAHMMVCEFGMSDKLGPMTFGEREEHIFLGREISRTSDYSEKTAEAIDAEVRRILDECYARARKILQDHKDKLIEIAETLLEREVLDGEEIVAIINGTAKKRTRKATAKAPTAARKSALTTTDSPAKPKTAVKKPAAEKTRPPKKR